MKLYWAKGTCALASHVVLAESGAPFELARISLRDGDQKKPEYIKVNPKSKVPALVLDDGQVLTENPAIIAYVSDKLGGDKLLPPVGDLARYRALEWLAWCASTVHPQFSPLFKNKEDATARENTQLNLDRFDQWLGGTFVLGDRFSAADAYTLVFYNWGHALGFKIGPRHLASVKALLEREGVSRALAAQEQKIAV